MKRLTRLDAAYPGRLRRMKRPPDPLWVDGELPDPERPTVGLVGTRRLTPYGARIAHELAMTFARAGAVIVSGLAQGIDSRAHAGAIEADGVTIAVLGEGLAWLPDHGPLSRRDLADRIRARGALVSEYALEVEGTEWTFPRRNATLAALSDVLLVVEAPEGSGALISAERAREMQRPVFVAPGPLGAPTWTGSHRFIAEGRGKLLASPQQVADAVGLRLAAARPTDEAGALGGRLVALLAGDAADADTIAAGLGIGSAEAAVLIAEQLLGGTIVTLGDGRFARR